MPVDTVVTKCCFFYRPTLCLTYMYNVSESHRQAKVTRDHISTSLL
jgi:hypothetical protein